MLVSPNDGFYDEPEPVIFEEICGELIIKLTKKLEFLAQKS